MSIQTPSHILLFMTYRSFLFVAIAAFSLSACQTWKGLQEDFSTLSAATSTKINEIQAKQAQKRRQQTLTEGACPAIVIDPQMDSMTEFQDMEKPSDETKISYIALTRAASECAPEGDILNMRLDLTFTGTLGPKARRQEADRPFFAYPYFIAVTDNNGEELAKEIFAASITYETNQNNIALVETIHQNLPLNSDGSLPPYQIHIGFQLTEEQLFYNASK